VELTQRERQLQAALLDANLAISSTLDLQTVLDFLLEKVDLVLPNSATTVSLSKEETGVLEPVACRNINEKEWRAAYRISQRLTGNDARNGSQKEALQGTFRSAQDGPAGERDIFLKYGFASHLEVPLINNGDLLGTVGFYTKKEHQLSKEEIDFLCMLTSQAAIAIQKSRLYEQTNKQAAELQRANRIKSDFLALISHELRTPLAAIIGYAGIVRDQVLGEINDKQQDALGKLLLRSNSLLAMIDSILQATLFETEEVKVERLEVNLVGLVGELQLLYRASLDKDLRLIWDYPAHLPVIRTDRAKLMYILQNLINNAIKFTERGFVKVSVRHYPKAQAVMFRVTDTGIGIPKKALPGIFGIFRQVDSSEKRLYGGMGIGLYIVKKFAEILGGKAEVKSKPGRGSVFTVTIPYQS
jgi:signal transduction histidine kinase